MNNQFHVTIIEISGNRLLYKIWKTLQFGYWTMVTSRSPDFEPEYSAERHKEILDALKTRDADRAKLAMQKHIEDFGKPVHEDG